MLIVLDNAESILDPKGIDSREIYDVVEELSQFDNLCLCITSRITTIPPECDIIDIPTLSIVAARDTFHRIYRKGERSDAIEDILKQLDFHPLSITLLATVAHQNRWDTNRLTREWGNRRTGVLRTDHEKSLAATIELSLASPMFQELGPDARALLEVVAFFPQGIDENNLGWLFPTTSNRENIFDKYCVLSLTHRSDGFVTMLAPLRDYLHPRNPMTSPPLCVIKERFFRRLSAYIDPNEPGSEESQWIVSEDVNIEHLLNVFTSSTDANSDGAWGSCATFMWHINQHKPRLVILGPKIEGLPNSHPFKPHCLIALSGLLYSTGNFMGEKRLLVHALNLWRERRNDRQVARTLESLAGTNMTLGLHKEGIVQVKEALEIDEWLNNTAEQVDSLLLLVLLLVKDGQVDAAEEAASRILYLSSGRPSQSQLCRYHHALGSIYDARGETEAAISHHEKALGIASSLNLRDEQISFLRRFVSMLLEKERFDDVQVHLEHLKSNGASDPFSLGLAAVIQACIWCQQDRFEEARSEVSHAIEVYERIGASEYLAELKEVLQSIEEQMNNPATSDSDESGEGELLGALPPLVSVDSFCTESE